MSKKVKAPDKKKSRSRGDRMILAAIIVLSFAALCVAGYGIGKMEGKRLSQENAEERQEEEDPLLIQELIAGEYTAEILEEDGEWLISLTLPDDFPFQQTTLNLQLPEGASVSGDSNCLITDMGGRPVVNLTVENAALTIINENESRVYRFQINLM